MIASGNTSAVNETSIPVSKFSLRLLSVLLLACHPATSADKEIFPGDSFEEAVEALQPGDRLIVHSGTYVDAGRISIGVNGSDTSPIVIEGAPGEPKPLITRDPRHSAQNTINVEGASYLTIRGLEISSNGGDGVRLTQHPSHITLEDLEIHDISVGINLRSDMQHISIRRNRIYRTNNTGEGIYVGCNNATCIVSDSIIENNWIHDTLSAEQGDGIEIKLGSHSIVVRDNVIHDTNWPCILLYGTEGQPRNVVSGNIMWNCGEAGIQVAADAVVSNNVILYSPDDAVISHPHQGAQPGNLKFVHNTIVTDGPCLRILGWDRSDDIVFANNAVYCGSGEFRVNVSSRVAGSGNVFSPMTDRISVFGSVSGRSVSADFVDARSKDVYPTVDSALLEAGDKNFTTEVDVSGHTREDLPDAGAYEWRGLENPGWTIQAGFKKAADINQSEY